MQKENLLNFKLFSSVSPISTIQFVFRFVDMSKEEFYLVSEFFQRKWVVAQHGSCVGSEDCVSVCVFVSTSDTIPQYYLLANNNARRLLNIHSINLKLLQFLSVFFLFFVFIACVFVLFRISKVISRIFCLFFYFF